MSTKKGQAKGRRVKREGDCPGSDQPASQLTVPGWGVCPACGHERMVYDSTLRGRGLLSQHALVRRIA